MSTIQIQSLNRNIANEHSKISYPYVEVLDPSDCVALVLPNLDAGELPVLCTFDGVQRQIGKIRKSARVLHTLMSISKLAYHESPEHSVELSTSIDCLEVLR